MNDGELVIVFFAAFTAMLAFGSVVLLCRTLKQNNEHVRNVLSQLTEWKRSARNEPNRQEVEEEQVFAQPAADGTLPYIHHRPPPSEGRPIAVRDESTQPPEEDRRPIPIDRLAGDRSAIDPFKDTEFTGLVAAIGI